METLLTDLRLAVRSLRRTPGFTAAAVLALALGIGATTALFSVVHAVLLRSLGWGEESRLINVTCSFPNQGLSGLTISLPELEDVRKAPFLESAGAYYYDTATLQGDPAEVVSVGYATGNLFATLGVKPELGRAWSAEEDLDGRNGVALVTYNAWRKRFGGNPGAVGSTVTLNGKPRTIIGVLPESFVWEKPHEFYLPFGFTPANFQERGSRYLRAVARLRPEISLAGARLAFEQLSEQLRAANPKSYDGPPPRWFMGLVPLRDRFSGASRQPLLILLGAVLAVLLIACANVANLLLARGLARQREIAVRSALGAGRGRLVRQLLVESGVLAVAGAGLGLLVAVWSLDLLLAAAPAVIRELTDVKLHRAVLAFAAGITVITTFVAGLVPALHVTRLDLASSLKDGARGSTGPGAGRVRSTLVVGQVALSLVLLVGAGLLLRSFAHVLEVNAGFEPQGVLAAQVNLVGPAYREDAAQQRYFAEAVRRAALLPGVVSAGAVNVPPLEDRTDWSYDVEGYARRPGEGQPDNEFRRVAGAYFKTMHTPIVRGREFGDGDTEGSAPVAMVNDAWARHYFPGEEVLGKRLRVGGDKAPWRSIVGVVADMHDFGFDAPAPIVYYVPLAQFAESKMTLMLRTGGSPEALAKPLRDALLSLDRAQPPDYAMPFDQRIAFALLPRRFPLQILGAFAALALVLSALGIYGVTAYGVTQRTREFGVRIAIGAQPRDVITMVIAGSLRLAVLGVCLGVLVGLVGARVLASQLYGVSAQDPLTYAAIALLLALVAVLASVLPALRATRVDPMSALRAE